MVGFKLSWLFFTKFCLLVVFIVIFSRFLLGGDKYLDENIPESSIGFDSRTETEKRYNRGEPVVKENKFESPRTKKNRIPVHVVEEHHEVIPYWYQAANEGRISRQGNILIHIDGHSDAAVPYSDVAPPVFKYPESQDEINKLMVRNDMFIVSALFSGLFSRVIWISPSWNTHLEYNINEIIGYGYLNEKTGNDDRYLLCACYSNLDYEETMKCYRVNSTVATEKNKEIPVHQCDIKQVFKMENVLDKFAAEQGKDWIPSRGNIVIDIDEDYYGVEAPVQSLLDVKISSRYIDDYLIPATSNIFCPRNATMELIFDKMFFNLLQKTSRNRQELTKNKVKGSVIDQTLPTLKSREFVQDLCDAPSLESRIQNLVEVLLPLNDSQLKAVGDMGICLSKSVKQLGWSQRDGMRLCEGITHPDSRRLVFHSPDRPEVVERTKQLEQILKNIPDPGVVSVCRSSRDGYVPVHLMKVIETEILGSLRRVFSDVSEESVMYDEELRGGKDGWFNRHSYKDW